MVVEHHFSECKVRAQAVQSSSAITFMALNFLRTTQPSRHQALCKSHCVAKTVHFYTVQTHMCFPNDFVLSPLCFVAHKRVKVVLSKGRRKQIIQCVTRCALEFTSSLSSVLAARIRGRYCPASSTIVLGIEGNMR